MPYGYFKVLQGYRQETTISPKDVWALMANVLLHQGKFNLYLKLLIKYITFGRLKRDLRVVRRRPMLLRELDRLTLNNIGLIYFYL